MSTTSQFRRLVAASGLSNLADGVFQIALPLVALGITRDPGAFASVTLVGRLPWLFFALPAGALADRLDRRHTMYRVSLARAAVIGALGVAVATSNERLWILYVVAFALGIGETLFDTAAQSILPNIISDPDALARANGRLYAVELTANQFVGPPLGGVIAGLTLTGALTGSAVAYFGAAVCLLALRGSFRPVQEGPRTRLTHDIREGVRYLFGHRILRTLAICVGISNLAFTAQFSVFPLYAVDPGPMGLSSAGFGVLLTAGAVGSLLASPVVDRVERRVGRFRALVVAIALFPLTSVVPAVTAAFGPNFAIGFFGGAINVVWNVITVSLRQRIVPDNMLGRVNAGYRLLAWGTMPIGAALGGLLGELVGLRGTFGICAGLGLVCVPFLTANVSSASLAALETEAEGAAQGTSVAHL